MLDDKMKELARHLMNDGSLLLFGRGYNYATALEAALKVKEVALMHRCCKPPICHLHSQLLLFTVAMAETSPSGTFCDFAQDGRNACLKEFGWAKVLRPPNSTILFNANVNEAPSAYTAQFTKEEGDLRLTVAVRLRAR